MPDKRKRRIRSADPAAHDLRPVAAIKVRGERYEIAPEAGYAATVIELAEYTEWRDKLRDKTTKARIAYSVAKLARGLMSDWKPIGDIYEMRIDFGPGYRVYFGKYNDVVFIVTLGGDKPSQKTDIQAAQKIWKDVRNGIQEIRD